MVVFVSVSFQNGTEMIPKTLSFQRTRLPSEPGDGTIPTTNMDRH
jgi:hypothetical protein